MCDSIRVCKKHVWHFVYVDRCVSVWLYAVQCFPYISTDVSVVSMSGYVWKCVYGFICVYICITDGLCDSVDVTVCGFDTTCDSMYVRLGGCN